MGATKINYQEGTLFAVPLRNGLGYGVGIVARLDKKGGVLGYFLPKRFLRIPLLSELQGLATEDSILVRRFGDLGLIKKNWHIIGNVQHWDRDAWPVPKFARLAKDNLTAWIVEYSNKDGISLLSEHEVPFDKAYNLPEDGLSGFGAIEIRLSKLLECVDYS
jgi:hypothetical protein